MDYEHVYMFIVYTLYRNETRKLDELSRCLMVEIINNNNYRIRYVDTFNWNCMYLINFVNKLYSFFTYLMDTTSEVEYCVKHYVVFSQPLYREVYDMMQNVKIFLPQFTWIVKLIGTRYNTIITIITIIP